MFEILGITLLSNSARLIAKDKGMKPFNCVCFIIISWLGLQVLSFVLWSFFFEDTLENYISSLLCAIIGGAVAYIFILNTKPKNLSKNNTI